MGVTQHRGVVVAKNGVVAASQPLAVAAGLNVLQQGGNFVDAAIATSAVLCVVEPFASHVGGDAFVIVYDGKTGQTTALNASGAAPQAATPDRFPQGIPLRGMAAVSVPGLVDAWAELLSRWGTRPLADLLEPAIGYAGEGFPAGYRYARVFHDQAPLLHTFPNTAAALTGGVTPQPGSIIRQPDLAWTLRQIAQGGRDAFYLGPIMERIVQFSRENAGLFAPEDFAAHRTQITEPIRTTYRGYTVHGQPPVSQGHILLQQLNLVEGFDLAARGHNSADTIHLQVEAKKLAFADRAAYLGDPNFVRVPMETLLSKEYADRRRTQIDPRRAAAHVSAGMIDHDTTYFCVADREGNAVSFIQSVFWGFGSAVVADGTGVLFNNRMTGFSLDPASPNVLQPGKRPAHTLNAYLVTKEGKFSPPAALEDTEGHRGNTEQSMGKREENDPQMNADYRRLQAEEQKIAVERLAFVGGTPGGDIQVQSNLQVICNVIDFGLNPQEAIEAARWQHGGSVGAPGETPSEVLAIEERVGEETRAELARRGHNVSALGPWAHGSSYQLIAVQPESGAYLAGSDPRCDGHAAGF